MSDGDLQLPARSIPVPASVSDEARAFLGRGVAPAEDYPPLDDAAGWKARVEAMDEMVLGMMGGPPTSAAIETLDVDGVTVYEIVPGGIDPADEGRVLLEIHGGALIMGSGVVCQAMGARAARRAGLRTWAVDYRMPPDHPYPTPLDDCVAAYRALLDSTDPADIVIGGGSAGGNLAAATVLRARDEGLPLPAGAVLLTPEVDLTESGDTFETLLGIDLLGRLMPANLLYAAGHDLAHPYLSPLFGDFTAGFPPTFLQSGTRDLFLSNTVRLHRALRNAGVEAELHVWEAMPHGGFYGGPEDAELQSEVRRFVASVRR